MHLRENPAEREVFVRKQSLSIGFLLKLAGDARDSGVSTKNQGEISPEFIFRLIMSLSTQFSAYSFAIT